MHTVMAVPMSSDTRAGSRDVSDPLGRGWGRSPGRRRGSLTSRLPYQTGIPGRHSTPAEQAADVDRFERAITGLTAAG